MRKARRRLVPLAGLLMLASAGCRDNQITSAEEFELRSGVYARITAGDGQEVDSEANLKPIVLQVYDYEGAVVPFYPVMFRVVDTTGIDPAAIDESKLREIWELKGEPLPEVADMYRDKRHTGKTREEIVGKVLTVDTETDANGNAEILIRAPWLYRKQITVLMLAETNLLTASFRTFLSGPLAVLELTTTNGQKEVAGESFAMQVTGYDDRGNVTAGIEGPVALEFTPADSKSWAGMTGVLPRGNITCPFVKGVCTSVPGGPWHASAAEELAVTVNRDGQNTRNVIGISTGTKKHLVLATVAGGPAGGATIMETVRPDQTGGDVQKPDLIVARETDQVSLVVAVTDGSWTAYTSAKYTSSASGWRRRPLNPGPWSQPMMRIRTPTKCILAARAPSG